MKIYTIEDFENFETDGYGTKICPSGDYSRIKHFGDYCVFGGYCLFGERCTFGMGCSFGKCCAFGEYCSFGEFCSFGDICYFGGDCSLGNFCSFGERCFFGKYCSFGEWCSFGGGCSLENNLRFENIKEQVGRVIKIDRIGSRKDCTYFFKTLSEIYVRCGCFFGTIAEFEAQVNETHKDNEQYKKEYLEAIRYIKAVM